MVAGAINPKPLTPVQGVLWAPFSRWQRVCEGGTEPQQAGGWQSLTVQRQNAAGDPA